MPKKKRKKVNIPCLCTWLCDFRNSSPTVQCQLQRGPFSSPWRTYDSTAHGLGANQRRSAHGSRKKDTRCTWPASNKPMFILSIDFLLERESIQITRRKVLAQDDFFVLKSLHTDVSPTLSFVTRREAAVAICHLGGVGGILVMSR